VSETRKLAAILVADVVGYSRLIGADEDRILARLRALRSDLIDSTIAVHRGQVVKRTGDGAIVEFRSVVDAVNCAIQVQRAMLDRNAGIAPDSRIEFRIGIHLGDVVEESDGDLMGDGVNIAARLEGVAQPGAICLSEQAYWQVKGRLDLKVTDLGATQLKNIAEPIRVYSLEVGVPAKAKPAAPSEPAPTSKARGIWLRRPAHAAALMVLALLVGTYVWRSGLAVRTIPAPASAPHASSVAMTDPVTSEDLTGKAICWDKNEYSGPSMSSFGEAGQYTGSMYEEGDGTWTITSSGVKIDTATRHFLVDIQKLPDGTLTSDMKTYRAHVKWFGKYCK
jgi:class 3 adenylate cyclase